MEEVEEILLSLTLQRVQVKAVIYPRFWIKEKEVNLSRVSPLLFLPVFVPFLWVFIRGQRG